SHFFSSTMMTKFWRLLIIVFQRTIISIPISAVIAHNIYYLSVDRGGNKLIKVVRTYDFPNALEIEKEVFKGQLEIIEAPSVTEDDLIRNCKDADAVICEYEPITKRVIDALPNLKLIAFGTIGFNYADVAYAKSKGIAVSHISKYCITEVADYTVGMMLMLNRSIHSFHNQIKEDGKWDFEPVMNMRRLGTQRVGVIGLGNIPKQIAEGLQSFGVKHTAYDPFIDI